MIWKNIIIPPDSNAVEDLNDETFKLSVLKVRKIATASNAFAIPDPKAFRSMSRASILLSHICQGLEDKIGSSLAASPFSVGIYCAVENGPIDAPSTFKIITGSPAEFVGLYRKLRGPKMYLKQLPNLVPAQLGISFGIQGMMNVYTHSKMGSLQALEQAEEDLWFDRIKLALVCSAHAFDDFLVVARTRNENPAILAEGAGAMLLKKNDHKTEWRQKIKSINHSQDFYGISNQIIQLLK